LQFSLQYMLHKDIYNALPHPTIVIRVDDPDRKIEYANNALFSILLDNHKANITDRAYFSVFTTLFADFPENALDCIKNSLLRCRDILQPDQTKAMPLTLQNRDVKYLRFLHSPVLKNNGTAQYIIQSIEDVTDQVLEDKKQKNRIRYKNILLKASNDFVTALFRSHNGQNLHPHTFSILGEAVDADRVYYFEKHLSPDTRENEISQRVEWSRDTISSQIDNPKLKNIPVKKFRELIKRLYNGKTFTAIVENLEEEELKKNLSEQNIQSLMLVPVFVKDTFHGFIGFDDCRTKRVWKPHEIHFLETASLNLSHAIERKGNIWSLQKSQQRYQSLINNIPGITYRCKADDYWTMEFMSAQTRNITGYPAEEFTGNKNRSFLDIIHPDDQHKTFKVIPDIHRNKSFALNYRIKTAHGAIRHMEETGQGIFDENGTLTHVEGVIYDITDKISLHEIFKAVFQSTTDAILLADNDANYIMVNDAATKMFGYSHEEFKSLGVFDLRSDIQDESTFRKSWSEFLKEEKQYERIELRDKNGKKLIGRCYSRSSILPDVNLLVMSDITELVLREEELKKNERRFKTLVEKGMDLIAILTPDKTYDYVAASSSRILDMTPDELLGKHIFDLIHPDDRNKFNKQLEKLRYQKLVSIEPVRFLDGKNNWKWLETTASNFLKDHALHGIVINSRDVTGQMNRKFQKNLISSIRNELNQSFDLKKAFDNILKLLTSFSSIAYAEAWITSTDKSTIKKVAYYANNGAANTFLKHSADLSQLHKGEGLPGITWEKETIQIWSSIHEHPLFVRKKAASVSNFRNGFGVPIIFDDEVIAIFTFITNHHRNELVYFEEILRELSAEIGTAIQQKKNSYELNRFFYMVPDLLCLAGFDGYFKKINPAFSKLLGYSEQELLSKPLTEFVHPEDRQRTGQKVEHISKNNSTFNFVNRYRRKDGEYLWISWAASPLYYEGIMFAIGKDITDLKESEQKLKRAYERLKTAQKVAKIGYWARDLSTDRCEWSDEVYSIYELDPETFTPVQSEIIKYFHPDDRKLVDSENEIYQKGDTFKLFEHRIITDSGKTKWLIERFKIIFDKNQAPVKIEGTIQDITDIKEKEQLLKISNERFEMAMKATSELIWDLDVESGRIVRSSGYQTVFGYDPDENSSDLDSWFESIHPDDRDEVKESFNSALQNTRNTQWYKEYRFIKANGHTAYIVDRGHIIRDESGKAIRVVGAVLDVTESRRMMREISIQNKRLKEIAWTQSHQVRAPLARLMGLVSVLDLDILESDMKRDVLEKIHTSAHELDEIIRDISHKTEKLE
jgi:PAS domain S-box-containing protein